MREPHYQLLLLTLLMLLLLLLSGCNYAKHEKPDGSKKTVASVSILGTPSQVSTGSETDDGPPKTTEVGANTTKTPISKAEAQAQVSIYIIGCGVGLVLLGVGLMVARHYTAGIAVPSWTPRLVIILGLSLAAWGSVPPDYRGYIAIVVVAGFIWMYYGSKNHNLKMFEEKKQLVTEKQKGTSNG